MDIGQFINQYYIEPILQHEGYNAVNTVTYALIAIAAVYIAYRAFQYYRIRVDRGFVLDTIPFVLLGSTVRVVTDSIDTGVMTALTPLHALIINSHVYDYGFFTSSPGIYIITAALFFVSLALSRALKVERLAAFIGLALWIPHLFVLLFMFKYLEFAIPVLVLALIPFYLAYRYFSGGAKKHGIDPKILAGVVGAHALDGAATFFIIDYFGKLTGRSYFEQHVIPGFIGSAFGTFFPFYVLKIGIAFGASYFIASEKDAGEGEKYFIALLLIIIGLAPGLRDLLRMAVGA